MIISWAFREVRVSPAERRYPVKSAERLEYVKGRLGAGGEECERAKSKPINVHDGLLYLRAVTCASRRVPEGAGNHTASWVSDTRNSSR